MCTNASPDSPCPLPRLRAGLQNNTQRHPDTHDDEPYQSDTDFELEALTLKVGSIVLSPES